MDNCVPDMTQYRMILQAFAMGWQQSVYVLPNGF